MANSWVEHCRKYAKKNKCTYKEATKLGKSSYQSSKKAPKKALKEPKPKKQVKKAQAKQAQAKQADKRTRKMECLKQAVESLKVKSAAKQARMAAKKEQKE